LTNNKRKGIMRNLKAWLGYDHGIITTQHERGTKGFRNDSPSLKVISQDRAAPHRSFPASSRSFPASHRSSPQVTAASPQVARSSSQVARSFPQVARSSSQVARSFSQVARRTQQALAGHSQLLPRTDFLCLVVYNSNL
jgi:hypothetical protein